VRESRSNDSHEVKEKVATTGCAKFTLCPTTATWFR
jgi:hypothetical protein